VPRDIAASNFPVEVRATALAKIDLQSVYREASQNRGPVLDVAWIQFHLSPDKWSRSGLPTSSIQKGAKL
jgi:hypothetical protein